MSRRRPRKYTKKKKELGLFGVSVAMTNKVQDVSIDTGLVLASAVAGGIGGAAIGKHSFLAGLTTIVIGAIRKSKYIEVAGAAMCMANGFQSKPSEDTQTSGTDGVDGLDIDKMKARVGTFFKNFSEKLYIPKKQEETASTGTTNGLGETPSYFINPFNTQIEGTGEVDMSQLDRVQQDIAQMGGFGNTDRIL